MKIDHTKLSARYLAALRRHVTAGRPDRGQRARSIGRAVLAAQLTPLELARMHQRAVNAIAALPQSPSVRRLQLERKGAFFTQALIPLESARRRAAARLAELHRRNTTLRLHTAALARGNRRLEQEITRRKAAESLIRRGREHYQVLFRESLLMQKKLRLLTRQIIAAQEEERKEISRELHDEVVQTLVGINVELTALSKGTSAGIHALHSKIARTQRLVEKSVNAVHRFARELRPAVLDDLGLIPALHAYGKNLAARKRLRIRLTAFARVESLRLDRRIVLFRVAQEALTNVARHAHATEVQVTLSEFAGGVRMEIHDDGQSFAVEKSMNARSNKRLGLVGMRERVEMVGGTLAIESSPGHGTTIRAEIPFVPERDHS